MLRELYEYADKYLHAEPGFIPKVARWALSFSEQGRYLGVVSLKTSDDRDAKGREFSKCPYLSQPEMKAGGEPKAHPLLDTADRLVMLGVEDSNAEARQRFEFHLQMLRSVSARVPALGLLAATLGDPETRACIQADLAADEAKPKESVTLQIGRGFPVEWEETLAWWREYRRTIKAAPEGEEMMCFLSGTPVVPVMTNDIKIKGLGAVGGQPAFGDVLVGFDKSAFESYGLRQARNAACSEEAAAAYCSGLNDLIARHSYRLAGALVTHWFKGRVPDEDDPVLLLEEGRDDTEEVDAQRYARELLEAVETGRRPDLSGNYYYALTLSGNSGRVIVRDWMEGRFENLLHNVSAWFDDLEIIAFNGKASAKPPTIERVVTSLLPPRRPGQKFGDWVKPVGPERMALWHAAISGAPRLPRQGQGKAAHGREGSHISPASRTTGRRTPLGYGIMSRLVVLDRAFRLSGKFEEVTETHNHPEFAATISLVHTRMALLKAYHLRKARQKGGDGMSDLQPYLNEVHPSPAYQCGRLLAVLAALQRSALGDVGAGVVQRYYAAASTTPALVLGRLTRTAQFHLNKLEGGLPYWYEEKLAEIWSRLGDQIPRTLDLEKQSLFALGYYQQLADMRTKKVVTEETQEGENDEQLDH